MDKKTKQRITPCICCNYPVTERHHLLEKRKWKNQDDDTNVVNLCPNCHQLYHLLAADGIGGLSRIYSIAVLIKNKKEHVDFIKNLIEKARYSEKTLLEDLYG